MTKQDRLAAGFRVSVDGEVEANARRDLAVLGEYAASRQGWGRAAGNRAAPHRAGRLSEYARSNLGRFALAIAAGNTPEDAAAMARTRANADRVEFAIEAALDRSGR